MIAIVGLYMFELLYFQDAESKYTYNFTAKSVIARFWTKSGKVVRDYDENLKHNNMTLHMKI